MSVESTVVNEILTKLQSLFPHGSREHDALVEATKAIEPVADAAADAVAPTVEHAVQQDAPAVEHAVEHAAETVLPAPLVEAVAPAVEHAVERELDPNNPGGVTYPWLHQDAPAPVEPAPAPVEAGGGALTPSTAPMDEQELASLASLDTAHDNTATAPAVEAGGKGGRALLDTPVWNQLKDGNDPQQANDCGFECASMVDNIVKRSEPNITEGTFREELGRLQGMGINRSGLTTASDLVQLLHYLGIAAHERTCNVHDAYVEWNNSIRDNRPVIALGRWVDPTVLHWVLFVASPPGPDWLINDPWGGERRTIDDTFVAERYAGQYVHVDSPVDSLA